MALTQTRFSAEDERRFSLIALAQQGDDEALATFVNENIGLVHTLLERSNAHKHPNATRDDLLSAGVEGMIMAVKKFDFDQDTKFSTYAASWILAYVTRCKMTMSRVYVSPTKKSQQDLIAQIESELMASFGRVPTDAEIAKYTKKFGESAVKDNRYPVVLDSIEEKDIDRPTHDSDDTDAIDVRQAIEKTEGLTDLHKKILRMIFGFDCEAMTMVEISEKLKIGRNVVAKQRDEALAILRESPLLEGYSL